MDYYHAKSGQHISADPFELGGVQYPANWLAGAAADEIQRLELVPVAIIGERGDERFFDNAEVTENGTTTITATPKPAALIRADLSQRIAEARYNLEVGGVTLENGARINTERDAQAMIASALLRVTRKPGELIDWKGGDGIWVKIDKATVEMISDVVGDHVQACFSAERARHEALAAIDDADFAALIAFDPSVSI